MARPLKWSAPHPSRGAGVAPSEGWDRFSIGYACVLLPGRCLPTLPVNGAANPASLFITRMRHPARCWFSRGKGRATRPAVHARRKE